jgi:ferredoxin
MAKIYFKKQQKKTTAADGSELLAIYQKDLNLPMKFGCTRGSCGVCAIEVLSGKENLTKCSPLELETLRKKGLGDSHRLACQCAVNGDVELSFLNYK